MYYVTQSGIVEQQQRVYGLTWSAIPLHASIVGSGFFFPTRLVIITQSRKSNEFKQSFTTHNDFKLLLHSIDQTYLFGEIFYFYDVFQN